MAQFTRSPESLPKGSVERGAAAKLKIEHFYKNLMEQTIERNQRYFTLSHYYHYTNNI
jgi:protein-serine/threonine kinase